MKCSWNNWIPIKSDWELEEKLCWNSEHICILVVEEMSISPGQWEFPKRGHFLDVWIADCSVVEHNTCGFILKLELCCYQSEIFKRYPIHNWMLTWCQMMSKGNCEDFSICENPWLKHHLCIYSNWVVTLEGYQRILQGRWKLDQKRPFDWK